VTVRDVAIRAAGPDDAPSIARVRVESWRWAYRGLVPDAALDALSVEDSELDWRRTIVAGDGISVFVAEDAGAAVGFVSAGPSRDAAAPADVGEIGALYVVRAHAGAGVGGALMSRAEDALRAGGFARATLWVLQANAAARGFYEHRGWAGDGTTSTHQVQCDHLPVVRYAVDL
jgi:GNAT superfamily N-acetyltransferase